LYHAYSKRVDAFSIGREALLDEVKWGENGWPVINEGRGPSGTAPSPIDSTERPGAVEFFDGFTAPQLDASWQWPMSGEQTVSVEVASGHLVLAPSGAAAASVDKLTGAVLGQRVRSGDYVATTVVDARAMATGANAGLSAYGWRQEAAGISIGGGRVFVWRREGQEERTIAAASVPTVPSVYLRMSVTNGEQFRFAYSANGREWKELGGIVLGSHIEEAHVALTVGGTTQGARFDWVKVTPAHP
ncbi:MAG TPA: hypothetical protein VJT09_10125, partial [Pyrinomonadaceae bacterium]|nr:hypothetical protein [Pyrinomonadaceae bacterium]